MIDVIIILSIVLKRDVYTHNGVLTEHSRTWYRFVFEAMDSNLFPSSHIIVAMIDNGFTYNVSDELIKSFSVSIDDRIGNVIYVKPILLKINDAVSEFIYLDIGLDVIPSIKKGMNSLEWKTYDMGKIKEYDEIIFKYDKPFKFVIDQP